MKISSSFSLFRASCRIRTNDPEITNHVLWPTELKRRGYFRILFFDFSRKNTFFTHNYRTDSRKRSTFVHLLIKNDEL